MGSWLGSGTEFLPDPEDFPIYFCPRYCDIKNLCGVTKIGPEMKGLEQ